MSRMVNGVNGDADWRNSSDLNDIDTGDDLFGIRWVPSLYHAMTSMFISLPKLSQHQV